MSGHTACKLPKVVVGPELQAECSEAQNQEHWSDHTTFLDNHVPPFWTIHQHQTWDDQDHLNKQPSLCASDSADAGCINSYVDQAGLETSSASTVSLNLSCVHLMEAVCSLGAISVHQTHERVHTIDLSCVQLVLSRVHHTYGSTSSSSGSQSPAASRCVACSPLSAKSRRYRPVKVAAQQPGWST